ncbi:alkaline phosphatase [Desulfobaculum xiamenense]|uniref:Alkaline phosphatase n=1 Tax=Desulfobaculum xiamenense TaxID=995050 RepID=A0A846QR06_9BACT|nr:alkaline phosphatase [Desulfobaculum xiamenense]NJB67634.1 alkaline phosphatase [Desulfobaculum xiamenense]
MDTPHRFALRLRLLLIPLLVLAALHGTNPAFADDATGRNLHPKYVFLLIGDGMGLAQRAAAAAFAGHKLVMDTLPATGLTATQAFDRAITDSAAAGTALATGSKTRISRIGIGPDGERLQSVAEFAHARGMKVGIVTTVSVDHATPAAFYAHVENRSMYHEIAHQLAESGFEYFAGGGLKDPEGRKSKHPKGDARDTLRSAGYRFVDDRAGFLALSAADGKVIVTAPRTHRSGSLPLAIDARPGDTTLAEFTAKGIELLDNPNGFFIMIEGGMIDWACHGNDVATTVREVLAFDDAVAEAVRFARSHPDDTLVVVTADHETGGLALGFAGTDYESAPQLLAAQKVSFRVFTDDVLARFRDGDGPKDFDSFRPIVTEHFGLTFSDGEATPLRLAPQEEAALRDAFALSMRGLPKKNRNAQVSLLYGKDDPLTVTLTRILANKAGMGWTTFAHTAAPVVTTAMGAGSEAFDGFHDNTDIAKVIRRTIDAAHPVANVVN